MRTNLSKHSDFKIATIVFVVTLCACFFSSYWPEFTRHTEADRALIGLEMWSDKDFLVPHLLGDSYLTKPPFFYWMVALSYGLFNSLAEWVPRFPNTLLLSTLLFAQYIFLRKMNWTKELSVLSVLILGTCGMFFTNSNAEIDSAFTALTTLGLFASFLSLSNSRSLLWPILAGVIISCAILTKGPQPMFFLSVGTMVYYISILRSSNSTKRELICFFRNRIVEWGIIILILAMWIYILSKAVGSEILWYNFNTEIFSRLRISDSQIHSNKPILFYVGALLVGMLPWSFALLGFLKNTAAKKKFESLYIYSAALLFIGLVVFSFSSAKASRYLFPLYPWAAIFLCYPAIHFKTEKNLLILKSFLLFLGCICGISALVFCVYLWAKVDIILIVCGAIVLLALSIFTLSTARNLSSWNSGVLLLVLLLVLFRVPYALLVDGYRNEIKSVKPLVAKIDHLVPKNEPIYVVELLERWIAYYLIEQDRQVFRISPAKAKEIMNSENAAFIYLILNEDEENWRVDQLKKVGISTSILMREKAGNHFFLLVKAPLNAAEAINPKEIYPTIPSEPYPALEITHSQL